MTVKKKRREIYHSKNATPFSKKVTATMRRPIFLCPLPSELFRVAPLVWLAEQCVAKGFNPLECEFYAALKRNRKFLVEYVLFGMLKDGQTVVSAKDWPENVLVALPSETEQISLARDAYHRSPKPTRWVTETTAARIVDRGMGEWEGGAVRMGEVLVGTYARLKEDHIYSGPNQFTYRKPIVYPAAP